MTADAAWTAPDPARLTAAMDATWPAAETVRRDGWVLRRSDGGGQRVSAATPDHGPGCGGDHIHGDIAEAEAAMRAWGQTPLFRVDEAEAALDGALAVRGYEIHDPVVLFAGPAAALAEAETPKGVRPVEVRVDLAWMREIWAEGGIGPGRLAVMDRAPAPKVRLAARTDFGLVACAFVGVDREVAMIHAMVVAPSHRRKGGGRALVRGAARFALDHGADTLALAVTKANRPARALYVSLGMTEAGRYHYRRATD